MCQYEKLKCNPSHHRLQSVSCQCKQKYKKGTNITNYCAYSGGVINIQ